MQFLNPAMLFGTLLFAVPLIIHLLNRQRYKRRRWAAMEYLLIAFKKQRRRLRVENLLLLLLRCLIPLILALAIARPVLREGGPLAGLGTSAHYFVVLDASYSMDYQPEGGLSPFQTGRRMIEQLLQRLAERAAATRVTLVIAGSRPRIPVQADLGTARASAELAKLTKPEDSASDLTEALSQVADLVEESTDTDKRVYIFTDLQVRAFGPDPLVDSPEDAVIDTGEISATDATITARDLLDHLATIGDVVILDVGPFADSATGGPEENVQISALRMNRLAAVAQVPVPIVATVANHSLVTQNLQVTLEIDGSEPSRELLELEAGAEGEVRFDITFRETGTRTLRASLQGDGLAADDERFLAVNVRERVRILVVDGTYAASGVPQDIHGATLIRDLLDPTGGTGPPELTVFNPKLVEQVSFLTGEEDPRDYDLVVLANLDRLTARTVEAIEDAMRGGTGLFVMLGDYTDVTAFNLLHGGGEGPMPMLLTRDAGYQPGGMESYYPVVQRPDHPVLSELAAGMLDATPVYRFLAADKDSFREDAQILVSLNDAEQSALLVATEFGNGKALFLTSAANRRPEAWNQFYNVYLAFPLFHSIAYWLSLPARDPFNTLVGAPLTSALDDRPIDVAVVLPERAGLLRVPIAAESRPLTGNRFTLPAYRDTYHAGIYNFEMTLELATGNEPAELPFAVSVNPSEGVLNYFSHDAAVDRLGVRRILRGLPSEGTFLTEGGSSELGPPLLMMVLLLVLGEAAMARFVTRRRN